MTAPILLADDEPPTGRSCDGCTLCCSRVPVKEIGLLPFTRCRHLSDVFAGKGRGCTLYPRHPRSCHEWRCLFLKTLELPEELRPSKCGIVVDEVIDVFRLTNNETGKTQERPTAQLWVSKGHEEDWDTVPLISGLVHALVEEVGAVIWRTPDGLARIFLKTPDGQFAVTPPHAATPDDAPDSLGPAHERLLRASLLYQEKRCDGEKNRLEGRKR